MERYDEATRGVNQVSDHAVRGSDSAAAAHVLRPGCSRRPTAGQCADVPAAQPVVDQREQFSGRGDLGDVLADLSPTTTLAFHAFLLPHLLPADQA